MENTKPFHKLSFDELPERYKKAFEERAKQKVLEMLEELTDAQARDALGLILANTQPRHCDPHSPDYDPFNPWACVELILGTD